MPGELLKFRCYQCGKLLGAPASKAGRTTTCPSCKAELIIPEPTAEPDLATAIRALTPRLETPATVTKPKQPPSHDPSFSWEEIDTALFKAAAATESILPMIVTEPPPVAKEASLAPISLVPAIAEVDLDLPTVSSPGMPEIEVEIEPVSVKRPSRRKTGDVVLSQAVLASWSVFVVLALAVSFVAGVFFGHFVWKIK